MSQTHGKRLVRINNKEFLASHKTSVYIVEKLGG